MISRGFGSFPGNRKTPTYFELRECSMKTVIIGKGKVGEATAASLCCEVQFHDPFKGVVVSDFSEFDFAIVCVDTLRTGPMDHRSVIDVLTMLQDVSYEGIVLIRSTVNPEFVRELLYGFKLRTIMFPEFMRQTDDLKMDDPWIVVLGGEYFDLAKAQKFLIEAKYCEDASKYLFTSRMEAAIIKLCQNAGLATKVIFFNMVYELCQKYGGDYTNVRLGVGADERVGFQYSVVPSPDDGKLGFKGHCLPKDVNSLSQIDDYGFFQMLLDINTKLGR